MDVLTDDHEREEAVKQWWHTNWKPIALGIVIALGGIIGVRQYQAYQLEQSQNTAYEVYQIKHLLNKSGDSAVSYADTFMKEHEDVYGAIMALEVANMKVKAQKYEESLAYLDFVFKNGGKLVVNEALLTKARLLTELKKYDEAIAEVKKVDSEAYAVESKEVLGDIYMAQNKRAEAHDAYLDAINTLKARKLDVNPILNMKFMNVMNKDDDKKAIVESFTQM